jgi:hypothetical protein
VADANNHRVQKFIRKHASARLSRVPQVAQK